MLLIELLGGIVNYMLETAEKFLYRGEVKEEFNDEA